MVVLVIVKSRRSSLHLVTVWRQWITKDLAQYAIQYAAYSERLRFRLLQTRKKKTALCVCLNLPQVWQVGSVTQPTKQPQNTMTTSVTIKGPPILQDIAQQVLKPPKKPAAHFTRHGTTGFKTSQKAINLFGNNGDVFEFFWIKYTLNGGVFEFFWIRYTLNGSGMPLTQL
uniref:Uncharacterized protein n=1 Tax=Oryza meridionalis TaxID=40149 RepID=A0A0E0ERS7_9ORYZ